MLLAPGCIPIYMQGCVAANKPTQVIVSCRYKYVHLMNTFSFFF